MKAVEGTQFCQSVSGFTTFELTAQTLTVDFRDFTNATLHTSVIRRA